MLDTQTGDTDSQNAVIHLVDSGGTTIMNDIGVTNMHYAGFVYNDMPAGTYYVRPDNANGQYTYGYTLGVYSYPGDAGNSAATVLDLSLGTFGSTPPAVTNTFLLSDKADWFRFVNDETTPIQAFVNASGGDLRDFSIRLRNTSGTSRMTDVAWYSSTTRSRFFSGCGTGQSTFLAMSMARWPEWEPRCSSKWRASRTFPGGSPRQHRLSSVSLSSTGRVGPRLVRTRRASGSRPPSRSNGLRPRCPEGSGQRRPRGISPRR